MPGELQEQLAGQKKAVTPHTVSAHQAAILPWLSIVKLSAIIILSEGCFHKIMG